MTDSRLFPVDSRVRHEDHGYGIVVGNEGRTIRVRFDDESSTLLFNPRSAPIERAIWVEGDRVLIQGSNVIGVVVSRVQDRDVILYSIQSLVGEQVVRVPEGGLSDAPAFEWPDEQLAAGRFDSPKQFYFRTLSHYLSSARTQLGAVGASSRIEPKPFQVFVVQRVVSAPQPRFLLADEVGLGKTIEAGLILQEMRTRGGLDHVLIVVPSNLALQWLFELKTKFNETFLLFDSAERLRSERVAHPGENIWDIARNVITTHAFIARLESEWDEIANVSWDMIIFDEAHHVRRQRDTANKITTSRLYKFASKVSQRSRGLLLLTATPMQLDTFELYSLVELLDPALFHSFEFFEEQRFFNIRLNAVIKRIVELESFDPGDWNHISHAVQELTPGEIPAETLSTIAKSQRSRDQAIDALSEKHLLSDVMIRNRKRLIGGFTRRIPVILPVQLSIEERQLYDDLGTFIHSMYKEVTRRNRFAVGFLLVSFQKRLTSSPYSFSRSLERRISRLESSEVRGLGASLTIDDVAERDLDRSTNQLSDTLLLSEGDARIRNEITGLGHLLAQAKRLAKDAKYEALEYWLEQIFANNNSEQVVIFTQFLDTLEYLAERLTPHWSLSRFHGQLSSEQKDEAIGKFQLGNTSILLTTEAGGEGRNLQNAAVLVNYDLPWNPMKVEQRIGRLDRIGQQRDVRIVNFSIQGTVEERVLNILHSRIHAFEETVGGLDPILGSMEADIQSILLESDPDQVDRNLEQLADRIDSAADRARQAENMLRDFALDRRSFRSVMDESFDAVEQVRITRHSNKLAKSFLKQIGADLRPIGDDTFRVKLGRQISIRMPSDVRETYQITFNQHRAMQEELVQFGTFGHPLFDALITHLLDEDFRRGLTAVRTIESREHAGFKGFQFNVVATFASLTERQLFLVIPISCDGVVRMDLKDLLLDSFDWRYSQLAFDPAEITGWGNLVRRSWELAENQVEELLNTEHRRLHAEYVEAQDAERQKINRFCDYREEEGRRKIQHDERIVARLQSSDREEDHRVIPVWERALENSRLSLQRITDDRPRLLSNLERRASISYSYELISAAWIQIVPPVSDSESRP